MVVVLPVVVGRLRLTGAGNEEEAVED